ncbi:adenylate/guanylate cyclase domain-containing protein [Mycobacterium ulcerans]|uniref:Adenylate cyclase n=2 Tax=Mycobacterium ulcerans TaxID=1809 RepID=A0PUN1_MYCUA|nr:adenylate/guanylate cyclase domain-containing protein [Mycobacterium ulcerans]ABL06050.1 adenylate cyclase [Mycobacterium ulcerans Agy99]MEB3903501.1 adenylate/guanylate cyclase domain-containing protein [Mycobacterium ulcerans]MEB3907641.1 adenylate/guanylate cyclase domain-containing protein [Mycobacterium ulcerans]MEB3918017.1 adenylate/guanylate cyclase domain-containing protein [Mycobacterium ulcerans]MEB3922067.1 adenylate/guanylate cyclase domain-containing protein [Mycobacterium ulc
MVKTVTRHDGSLLESPAYGSWLLGDLNESQRDRRIRIRGMLTAVIAATNVIGICVGLVLATVAAPAPHVLSDAPLWITFAVMPAYVVIAFALGSYWLARRTTQMLRWAIERREPSPTDQRNTLLAPFRFAIFHLLVWGTFTILLTALYGMANSMFIPRFLFALSFCGLGVTTASYMFTEFALRPVAAMALAAGPPLLRWAPGIRGRTIVVWLTGSGVPLIGMALVVIFDESLWQISQAEFSISVVIVSSAMLALGLLLMWILSWLTTTPVKVVCAALKRVEMGDLPGDLVVFDGTELGQLQRGFNAMVAGLRERERVRDLFGRHVGREVAAAAERERPKLGGEDRHIAVVFIDIVGSTRLVTTQPPAEVVKLLNRFFAIVVDEVDRHRGLVNKFLGDAALAIFGAPNRLEQPEDQALAAARAIARRLAAEVPECQAGIGVAAGQAVAGNVGANERFEYTAIGEPVNEAARLCELAKSFPGRLLASAETLAGASESVSAQWCLGDSTLLRGLDQPTRLATPIETAELDE